MPIAKIVVYGVDRGTLEISNAKLVFVDDYQVNRSTSRGHTPRQSEASKPRSVTKALECLWDESWTLHIRFPVDRGDVQLGLQCPCKGIRGTHKAQRLCISFKDDFAPQLLTPLCRSSSSGAWELSLCVGYLYLFRGILS